MPSSKAAEFPTKLFSKYKTHLPSYFLVFESHARIRFSAELSPPAPGLVSGVQLQRPAVVSSSEAALHSPPGHRPSPAAGRPVSSAPPPDWQTAQSAASRAPLLLPAGTG